MASLIDKTYFNYEINIQDTDFSELENYISRYESEILTQLLGYELYALVAASTETSGRLYDLINGKEYTISYNGRDQKVKWNGLKNSSKKSLIAYYVFYWWNRNHITIPTGSGEAQPKFENAVAADLSMKAMAAWRRMRDLYGYDGQDLLQPSAYNFLTEHEDDYPEWVFSALGSLNAFDL